MFKFAVWLLGAFLTSFLIPIPGCAPVALVLMVSITAGLLLAQ
jgi:ABC-type thiamin/hydroxymethylpyrimidine transport system permease subunit